ncbi:sterile alpha motif domain-containing protein 3-like isoform X6 [Cyprinus carpio]|nr:sterile alpha motif domain-containing protein 3-like isoform X6 [Cyprinus carpio]XP_042575370.1 sterile alpha motif domain-containing protein 3-like isoform X6 [Cyprinus carpio]
MKETVTLTLEPVPVESQSRAGASNISPSTAFPAFFEVPKFPFDVQAKLDQKECRLTSSDRNKIIRTLYESMAQYKMYPTTEEYVQVAKALTLRYPFLKDKEGNGYHTWHMSLKRKFKFERTPLAEVEEVKRLKQKFGHSKKSLQPEESSCKEITRPLEINAVGEDATSIEGHVKVLQDQYRRTQPETHIVEDRMRRTFAWRRQEITSGMTVEDVVNKYPFLKSPSGLYQEIGFLYKCVQLRSFSRTFWTHYIQCATACSREIPFSKAAQRS